MAQSDTPETTGADTFVPACGSPLGRIAAPPLHCTRPRGHDSDHGDGVSTWRDPDWGAMGGGPSASYAAQVAGGTLSGRAGGASSTSSVQGAVGNGSLPELGVAAAVARERADRPGESACGHYNPLIGIKGLACERARDHDGAHATLHGATWSSAPPVGPVPERFRHNVVPGTEGLPGAGYFSQRMRPDLTDAETRLFVADIERERSARRQLGYRTMKRPPELKPFRPDATTEVLLAGLVACGRALGRIEVELEQRKLWRTELEAAQEILTPPGADLGAPPTDTNWADVGRRLLLAVTREVRKPTPEPTQPIQARAEALAILILNGQRKGVPPNFLIRAGAVVEVLRAAWRKAQRGGS